MNDKAWRAHVGHLAVPTVALAGGVLLAEAGLWVATLRYGLPWWVGLPVSTLVAYVAFTPMHDATHGAIGGKGRAWVDAVVGHVMSTFLFAPFAAFRTLHLRHHTHTNDPDRDPDMWVVGSSALSIAARCLTMAPNMYAHTVLGGLRGDASLGRQVPLALLTLLTHLLIGVILANAGLGVAALTLWVLPGLLAVGLLAFVLDWVPHHPHTERRRGLNTRVLDVPALTVPLLAQNYHLVHHLYPAVPFYRMPALFEALRPELEASGAPFARWGDAGAQRR